MNILHNKQFIIASCLPIFFLILFYCSSPSAHAQMFSFDYSEIDTFPQQALEIIADINTEWSASQYYTLSWSIFNADGNQSLDDIYYNFLQCFIYDSKGLAGSYTGSQPTQQSCGFSTTDRVVDVFFRVRRITIDDVYLNRFKDYSIDCNKSEFRKIRLIVKHTKSKHVLLENNTGIVTLTHRYKGALFPDNMPCKDCCGYDMALDLSKPYLSTVNGKILKGSQWVNRKSIATIVNKLHLVEIDPAFVYHDKAGNAYTGQTLINMKQIPIESFDVQRFFQVKNILPYPKKRFPNISNLFNKNN